MGTKIPQTREDLLAHLNEQAHFLDISANSYDEGFEGEAKRMAISIRIIVHNTQSSTGLLAQLDMMGTSFYSTAPPVNPRNLLGHTGFLALSLSSNKYEPTFDCPPHGHIAHLTFDQWWNELVLKDGDGRDWTRASLVLAVANQDGGGHVDPKLPEKYYELTRNNSMKWIANDGDKDVPMQGPHLPAIRQIAHEMLKTLRPGMALRKPKRSAVFAMPALIAMMPGEAPPPNVRILPTRRVVYAQNIGRKKIGRNEPCPCGNGKKYKRCHGA